MVSSHPSEFDLERASTGERVDFLGQPVAQHIASCTRCSAAISGLAEERRIFLTARPAHAFVARLDRRSAAPRPAPRFQVWAAAAVCGAVALGIGVWPTSQHTPSGWQAKGNDPNLYVIRRRNDEQHMERERIAITSGDELRLHFSLPTRRRLAAGILSDDGTWVPFFEREFEAGSHTPTETLRVDATPNSGTILFGAPEEVERARRGQAAAEIQKTALIWKAPL